MNFAQTLQEDRRGIILCALDEMGGSQLGEDSLKSVLAQFGHLVSGDQVRSDLHWLETETLVRVTKSPLARGGDVWVVQLLARGEDVARGVRHPGVKKQAPKQ